MAKVVFRSTPKYRKCESPFATNSDCSQDRFSKGYLSAETTKACLRLVLIMAKVVFERTPKYRLYVSANMSFSGLAAWKSPVFKLRTASSLTAMCFTHYTALSHTAPHAKVLGGVPQNQGGTFFSEAQTDKSVDKSVHFARSLFKVHRGRIPHSGSKITLSIGRGPGNQLFSRNFPRCGEA